MSGKQGLGGLGARPQYLSPQAYPEVGTVEGLASLFMDLLGEASWADRVHVLQALLRLLPGLSSDLCGRLQGILVHLLNLDRPPSLEVCPCPTPPAPPHWAGHPLLSPLLCSGPDAEAVCDAGAAAAPGLLPAVPRGGLGAHVLLPLLTCPLPVSPLSA